MIKYSVLNSKFRAFYKTFFMALISVLLVSACTINKTPPTTQKLNLTHTQRLLFNDSLPVTIWVPNKAKESDTVRVYIEGDGRAWIRKNRISTDPTPRNKMVHALVVKDQKIDTAYIARPCQYNKNSHCHSDIWTFSRYSTEVMGSINTALTIIKEQKNYRNIELIGFSGGATVALILAATRNDITSVRTLAGNLDPEFTNRLHQVTAMPNALNPAHYAHTLQFIPQNHFIGENDVIIPASVFKHYQQAFSKKDCLQSRVIKNANHHQAWVEHWNQLLTLPFSC